MAKGIQDRAVDRWREQARTELVTAQALLSDKIYYAAAFHAQQAAELALKAAWIEARGTLAPRTHDTRELGRALGTPDRLDEPLTRLAQAYITTRYPDASDDAPSKSFSRARAEQLVDDAQEVIEWLDSLDSHRK